MGYLLYVSHDAENLQFYLWLHDYSRRFWATSRTEQVLSPPWDDEAAQAIGNDPGPRMPDKKPGLSNDFKFDFDTKEISLEPITDRHSFIFGSIGSKPARLVDVANAQTDPTWQSCEFKHAMREEQEIDGRSHNPAFSLRSQPNHLPLPGVRLTPRAQPLRKRPHSMRRSFLPALVQSTS